MTPTYLDEILRHHRGRAAKDQRDWRARLDETRYVGPSFVLALRQGSSPFVKVIAEIKRRSPSKGVLNEDLDVDALAHVYRDAGASAISVLTDHEFFGGSFEDLARARTGVELPVLRKDFTVSENDVLDAAEAGAGAVLLIVAALSDQELSSFLAVAETCGVDAVVEVHDEAEAVRALDAGARIIGVNQRDLRTFEVDSTRGEKVMASLPRDTVSVCESGLREVADVERVAEVGFDAVLVGEAFVTAAEPSLTVKSFSMVPTVQRA